MIFHPGRFPGLTKDYEALIDPLSPYTPKHPALTADDIKKFDEEPDKYDFKPTKLDLSPEFHPQLVKKLEPIKSDYNLRSRSKSTPTTFKEKVKINQRIRFNIREFIKEYIEPKLIKCLTKMQ